MNMLTSSVGKKIIMACTGVILILFITGHVLGNLSIYYGPNGINAYAVHLRDLGPLLWLIRLAMLAIFLVHIWVGLKLTLENKDARPLGYNQKQNLKTGFAAQTMIISGLILFAFVVYHVLHFTLHVGVPDAHGLVDSMGRFNVYAMVVDGFKNHFLNVVVYIAGMVFLLLHVSHGFGSFFQTLGLARKSNLEQISGFGKFYALVVFLGYISIPIIALAILQVRG